MHWGNYFEILSWAKENGFEMTADIQSCRQEGYGPMAERETLSLECGSMCCWSEDGKA